MSNKQGYYEPKDTTGVAKNHSEAAKIAANKKKASDISNAEIRPTPAKLFTFESVEETKKQIREGLDFPHVHIQSSTLGGKENVSILVTVSKDPKSDWSNKILQNSRYAQLHINQNGVTEQLYGWQI